VLNQAEACKFRFRLSLVSTAAQSELWTKPKAQPRLSQKFGLSRGWDQTKHSTSPFGSSPA